MKHIKISIVFIFLAMLFAKVQAQSMLCPAINAFVGEWRYTNGQDTIRVYLRAKDYTIMEKGRETIAILWGWHEYKRGNVIVESSYNNRNISLPPILVTDYTIGLQMTQCDTSLFELIGHIDDLSQCREMKVVTITYNTARTQLIWEQRHSEGYGLIGGCKGMTLPRNFTLIKQ